MLKSTVLKAIPIRLEELRLTGVFSDEIVAGATDSKWFKDAGGRYYIGRLNLMEYGVGIKLDASTNDRIYAMINDDLTGQNMLFLRIIYHAMREL